jgi:hypothetical protein
MFTFPNLFFITYLQAALNKNSGVSSVILPQMDGIRGTTTGFLNHCTPVHENGSVHAV